MTKRRSPGIGEKPGPIYLNCLINFNFVHIWALYANISYISKAFMSSGVYRLLLWPYQWISEDWINSQIVYKLISGILQTLCKYALFYFFAVLILYSFSIFLGLWYPFLLSLWTFCYFIFYTNCSFLFPFYLNLFISKSNCSKPSSHLAFLI